nr:immunoglobulin light chain junction region [Macaca mulatta]MOX07674.1 immunoglobulin light chain junction region [Macaca mulatta]MOX07699.1 immunoglobulin light chain junction region [Macaca mulatta]MOX08252.1 immunoglobulin light chain junction region [Macaca mulatta]MOX08842.1 immunoglobulin light chain junction region [Macaca mulatta]
CQQHDNPPYTF